MKNFITKITIIWIRFKLGLRKEPYGESYKGIVYLNKPAQEIFKKAN